MAPPAKRRKGDEDHHAGHDDDINDDELSLAPEQFDQLQDAIDEAERHRARSDATLKSKYERIFAKYEKDFSEEGDVIDLRTGKLLVDKGHLKSLPDERDDAQDDDLVEEEEGPATQDSGAETIHHAALVAHSRGWPLPQCGLESQKPLHSNLFHGSRLYGRIYQVGQPHNPPEPLMLPLLDSLEHSAATSSGRTPLGLRPIDPAWQTPESLNPSIANAFASPSYTWGDHAAMVGMSGVLGPQSNLLRRQLCMQRQKRKAGDFGPRPKRPPDNVQKHPKAEISTDDAAGKDVLSLGVSRDAIRAPGPALQRSATEKTAKLIDTAQIGARRGRRRHWKVRAQPAKTGDASQPTVTAKVEAVSLRSDESRSAASIEKAVSKGQDMTSFGPKTSFKDSVSEVNRVAAEKANTFGGARGRRSSRLRRQTEFYGRTVTAGTGNHVDGTQVVVTSSPEPQGTADRANVIVPLGLFEKHQIDPSYAFSDDSDENDPYGFRKATKMGKASTLPVPCAAATQVPTPAVSPWPAEAEPATSCNLTESANVNEDDIAATEVLHEPSRTSISPTPETPGFDDLPEGESDDQAVPETPRTQQPGSRICETLPLPGSARETESIDRKPLTHKHPRGRRFQIRVMLPTRRDLESRLRPSTPRATAVEHEPSCESPVVAALRRSKRASKTPVVPEAPHIRDSSQEPARTDPPLSSDHESSPQNPDLQPQPEAQAEAPPEAEQEDSSQPESCPRRLSTRHRTTPLSSLVPDGADDDPDELSISSILRTLKSPSFPSSLHQRPRAAILSPSPSARRLTRRRCLLSFLGSRHGRDGHDLGGDRGGRRRSVRSHHDTDVSTAPERSRERGVYSATNSGSTSFCSPLARLALDNVLRLNTPLRRRPPAAASAIGSPVRTPGGTVRRCGQEGFVCDRDFCFRCCK